MTDKSKLWSRGTHAEHWHAEDGVDVPCRQWSQGGSEDIATEGNVSHVVLYAWGCWQHIAHTMYCRGIHPPKRYGKIKDCRSEKQHGWYRTISFHNSSLWLLFFPNEFKFSTAIYHYLLPHAQRFSGNKLAQFHIRVSIFLGAAYTGF